MSKKDKKLVGVVLAIALAVGLVLVWQGLLRADDARQAYMDSLWEREDAPTEAEETPSADEALSALPTGADQSENTEEAPAAEDTEEELSLPPESSGPDLGAPPMLAADEVSLEELVSWMQTESSGAIEAKSVYEQETAIASGSGSSADGKLRKFAETQREANLEARNNQLAELGTELGLNTLCCRDLLALEQERIGFLEGLAQSIEKWPDPKVEIPAQTELMAADREKLSAALDEARSAAEAAEKELLAAEEAVNTVTGRELTCRLTMTGELSRTDYAVPDEESAAEMALLCRNEPQGALWQITLAEQQLEQLRYEAAPDSPEMLSAQQALSAAQANYPAVCSQVEADVRNRCRDLLELSNNLQQENVPAAPETAYAVSEAEKQKPGEPKAWTSNLEEILEQFTAYYDGRQKQIRSAVQFNLAALQLQHAAGVGVTAVNI